MVLEPKLLFIAIMPFTLVLPLITMALLRKNTQIPITNWHIGCLCLASGYVLIALRDSLPIWAGFHLSQLAMIGGICLMLVCYRQNLGWAPRWLFMVVINVIHLMIFSVLLAMGDEVLRQIYVNLVGTALLLSLIYHSRCLEKRHDGRGLQLCSIGFILMVSGHFVRLLGMTLGFGASNPVAPSWDNLLFMAALLLGTLLINYGYFGYEDIRHTIC